ncbi:hypothetical protein K461DRAFT_277743 [Myriangium duriaei CBS 260.36]|uniref:GRF-type domain-containing protein n=1 Tax=Myriangium duriaei CBS 260.36 TaxID=1168546 RepID=A0A9P4J1Z7_9PEZI|nr:hypothetical protein K461DRAFT_277743 [Myriangium duriaei CBS 260.36]
MFNRTPTGRGSSNQPFSRYNSGNGRGGPSNKPRGNGTPKRTTAKGLFADGIWQCECNPRLPAEHFRVKKDGPNHGRWFYTCQNAQDKRCGFFLWDEDAKPREESAVLNNSRTEAIHPTSPTRKAAGGEANPAWQQQQAPPPTPSKRKASPIDLDDSTTDDEDELISWPATGADPSTPRKAAKTTAYATPSTTRTRRLPWLDYTAEETAADPTPDTPSKPPTIAAGTAAVTTPVRPAPGAGLPTPESKAPWTESPARGAEVDAASMDLTGEVLGLLSSHAVQLSVAAEKALRAALGRQELKLQGAVKGRELVRTALRAREARIVELNARLVGVEAEREVLRAGLRRREGEGEGDIVVEEGGGSSGSTI